MKLIKTAIYMIVLMLAVALVMEADGQTLTASWYSVESCKREGTWQKYGGRSADGQIYDDTRYTCASWDYEFGTFLEITNTRNGKTVVVEVTDRGPAKRLYRKGRVIDLSKHAFKHVAQLSDGVVPIRIRKIK